MSHVIIQKRSMALGDGTAVDRYLVPSISLQVGNQKKLIPNPSGQEVCFYNTLQEAITAIQHAGFDAEFEGRPAQQTSSERRLPLPKDYTLAQYYEKLIPRLKDSETAVVIQAIQALGCLEDVAILEPLLPFLSHDDADVRRKTAEALSKLGGDAIAPLIRVYSELQHKSERNSVHGRLSVMAAFQEMILHERADLLSRFMPLITEALEDESWLVRAQAATSVGMAVALQKKIAEKMTSSSPQERGR